MDEDGQDGQGQLVVADTPVVPAVSALFSTVLSDGEDEAAMAQVDSFGNESGMTQQTTVPLFPAPSFANPCWQRLFEARSADGSVARLAEQWQGGAQGIAEEWREEVLAIRHVAAAAWQLLCTAVDPALRSLKNAAEESAANLADLRVRTGTAVEQHTDRLDAANEDMQEMRRDLGILSSDVRTQLSALSLELQGQGSALREVQQQVATLSSLMQEFSQAARTRAAEPELGPVFRPHVSFSESVQIGTFSAASPFSGSSGRSEQSETAPEAPHFAPVTEFVRDFSGLSGVNVSASAGVNTDPVPSLNPTPTALNPNPAVPDPTPVTTGLSPVTEAATPSGQWYGVPPWLAAAGGLDAASRPTFTGQVADWDLFYSAFEQWLLFVEAPLKQHGRLMVQAMPTAIRDYLFATAKQHEFEYASVLRYLQSRFRAPTADGHRARWAQMRLRHPVHLDTFESWWHEWRAAADRAEVTLPERRAALLRELGATWAGVALKKLDSTADEMATAVLEKLRRRRIVADIVESAEIDGDLLAPVRQERQGRVKAGTRTTGGKFSEVQDEEVAAFQGKGKGKGASFFRGKGGDFKRSSSQQRGTSVERPATGNCFGCGKPGHRVAQCPTNSSSGKGRERTARDNSRGPRDRGERRPSRAPTPAGRGAPTDTCWTCGGRGHRSPACPAKGQSGKHFSK
jgi:hypothetical protein